MAAPSSVSFLLPFRDAEATLSGALASLVAQTFRDWECLAVDDHSRDASRRVAVDWASREPRIRVLDAPEPGGIVCALEFARKRAHAPLLARQDADDRSHPSRLDRQVDALRADPRLAVVGCLTECDGPAGEGMERYRRWLGTCTDASVCACEIWVESVIAHPTVLARAAVIEEVGGYRERDWPEDYDLWLRVHRAGWGMRAIPEILYTWRDSPERLSRRDPRYAPAAFLRCRLHHLRRWMAEKRIARPLVVWGAGRDGRRLARAWEKERRLPGPPAGEIVAFLDIDPRKIGRRRRGLPVLDPDDGFRRFRGAFYLVAVGIEGARSVIRGRLTGAGLVETRDFLCLH